mgnify:CR=1 FL=1
MLTTVKDAVRRTRQHHAIEHATLHLLASRLPGRRMAGYSDAGGFTVIGDIPFDQVRRAVSDALLHLQAGESGLAIQAATTMADGAEKVVLAVSGGAK